MVDQQPTQGQRTQLERISSIYWALVGEQPTPGAPISYRLIERGTGRAVHALTVEMVASLLQAGWIEPSGEGNARRWGIASRWRAFARGMRAGGEQTAQGRASIPALC